MEDKIKVYIADDHELFVHLLSDFLSKNGRINIVGSSYDGLDLLEKLPDLDIDILLLDLSMPSLNGIEILEIIEKRHFSIKPIVISSETNHEVINECVTKGASGFLTKTISQERDIVKAIRTVHDGGHFFCKYSMSVIAGKMRKNKNKPKNRISNELTDREIDIIKFISKGMTSKEIAERLDLSKHTIDTHKRRIFRKCEVKNSAGLVMKALDLKIIQPGIL
jgi:DNA-binding NarL/FixJ family response regulator